MTEEPIENADDWKKITLERLKDFPEHLEVCLGKKCMGRDELMEEVENETEIGWEIVKMQKTGLQEMSRIAKEKQHLEFNDYQEKTEETAVYPEDEAIHYLALGLNGEAGEVAEKIKKAIRDDKELDLEKELGDVLWYLSRLSDELGYDFSDVANTNLDKLFDRKERGKIHGDGDDR